MKNMSLKIILILFSFFYISTLSAQDIGSKIQVKWELIDNNYQGQRRSLTKFNILNRSDHSIPKQDWSLWFSNMRSIDVTSLQGDFILEHINGDLYKLSPSEKFAGLDVNDSIEFTVVVNSR